MHGLKDGALIKSRRNSLSINFSKCIILPKEIISEHVNSV